MIHNADGAGLEVRPASSGEEGGGNGVLTSKEMFWNGVVDFFKPYGLA
jgi:hypothetical protein